MCLPEIPPGVIPGIAFIGDRQKGNSFVPRSARSACRSAKSATPFGAISRRSILPAATPIGSRPPIPDDSEMGTPGRARVGDSRFYPIGATGTRRWEYPTVGFVQRTARVGSYAPNAWGLYNLHGKVWEWCQVCIADYPRGSVADPIGPASGYRVSRACGWNSVDWVCRSACRGAYPQSSYYDHLGVRVAVVPDRR